MKLGNGYLETSACLQTLPMTRKEVNGEKYYNTSFAMYVANEEEEGLYNLYFHSCPNYNQHRVSVDFSVNIYIHQNFIYIFALEFYLEFEIFHFIYVADGNKRNKRRQFLECW